MMQEYLAKLVAGQHLTEDEAEGAMGLIMAGEANEAQIGAFLTALHIKGETVSEIVGAARAMRAAATRVACSHPLLVDTCGTGGDGLGTFNISTTAAFVTAAAGVPVAKHGNRMATSRSGSADVLEALGVNIALTPEQVGKCLDSVGIGFLFAQKLHTAMKYAAGPRKALGFRTIFNVMGPLTNPAGAQAQLLGVYDPGLTEVLASVLARLGTRRALVVHGEDGLDEISICAATQVSELKDGQQRSYRLTPEDVGLERACATDLQGGSPAENAEITRAVLAGERGPRRDVVVLNAAGALMVGGAVSDLTHGVRLAQELIDSGRAAQKLQQLQAFSQRLSQELAG